MVYERGKADCTGKSFAHVRSAAYTHKMTNTLSQVTFSRNILPTRNALVEDGEEEGEVVHLLDMIHAKA